MKSQKLKQTAVIYILLIALILLTIELKRVEGLQLELLELIFLSEKREQLLLYLKDGPKNIDEIKEVLQVSATTILTQSELPLPA